jgi:hypothetical protein
MEEKKRKQLDRIEKALGIAHREQTVQGLSPEWRQGVMRHIRRLNGDTKAKERRPSTALAFQKMLLPAATATGLVAIALLAYLLTALPGMEQDLFAALTQDPSGFVVTQELGM